MVKFPGEVEKQSVDLILCFWFEATSDDVVSLTLSQD